MSPDEKIRRLEQLLQGGQGPLLLHDAVHHLPFPCTNETKHITTTIENRLSAVVYARINSQAWAPTVAARAPSLTQWTIFPVEPLQLVTRVILVGWVWIGSPGGRRECRYFSAQQEEKYRTPQNSRDAYTRTPVWSRGWDPNRARKLQRHRRQI